MPPHRISRPRALQPLRLDRAAAKEAVRVWHALTFVLSSDLTESERREAAIRLSRRLAREWRLRIADRADLYSRATELRSLSAAKEEALLAAIYATFVEEVPDRPWSATPAPELWRQMRAQFIQAAHDDLVTSHHLAKSRRLDRRFEPLSVNMREAGPSAADRIELQDLVAVKYQALATRLTPAQRKYLDARVANPDASFAELAADLGCSASTVRVHHLHVRRVARRRSA